MILLRNLKKILLSKVVFYLVSRYFTYFIQFLISIVIAVRLGPYYFGIWSFLLLLLSYFRITNLGISNSINVLLVQNKDDQNKIKNLSATSYFLTGLLCLCVVLLSIYYWKFGISYFDKFEVGIYFYPICLIAIFVYFNTLFMTIYRVRNRLFEIAFYQSIIPLLVLISVFVTTGKGLITVLICVYLLGNIISLIVFFKSKFLPVRGVVNLIDTKIILKKGVYLFIYNISIYLLIISVQTIISIFYTVQEFGFFTLSYTLSNAMLLLLKAVSFMIFPKLIDMLTSEDPVLIEKTIKLIRLNYCTLAHFLVYVALLVFPLFLYIMPQYNSILIVLDLVALSILLDVNSFGHNMYLMAQNKENLLALITFSILVFNIILALFLSSYLKVSYSFVILSVMCSYFILSILFAYFSKRTLGLKVSPVNLVSEVFPINLFIPYISAVFLVVFDLNSLIFIPLLLFVYFNFKDLKGMINTIKTIINKPGVINI